MNDIIPFQRDPHDRTLKLLPWLVSGRLDAEEQAEVEAHLETCPDCRDELEAERALGRQVAGLSFDVERGWERLRGRIEAADGEASATSVPGGSAGRRRLAGLVMGGQTAAIAALLLVMVATPEQTEPPQYRALSTAEEPVQANLITVFDPETTERELRGILSNVDARVVDGPTVTGGYLLRVPDGRLDAVLAKLRAEANVIVAEPIEMGGET